MGILGKVFRVFIVEQELELPDETTKMHVDMLRALRGVAYPHLDEGSVEHRALLEMLTELATKRVGKQRGSETYREIPSERGRARAEGQRPTGIYPQTNAEPTGVQSWQR